ncbi:hypothetical protein J6590_009500 [Homalodisca vitripennis]|nr:hypothetical protein J6590_009500 [Homalodisca vitripennis]
MTELIKAENSEATRSRQELGVPMAERSKTLDLESELEIAQVRILSVTLALFISTIDLVLYRLSPLFCLIRSSHRPVAHEGGQSHYVDDKFVLDANETVNGLTAEHVQAQRAGYCLKGIMEDYSRLREALLDVKEAGTYHRCIRYTGVTISQHCSGSKSSQILHILEFRKLPAHDNFINNNVQVARNSQRLR